MKELAGIRRKRAVKRCAVSQHVLTVDAWGGSGRSGDAESARVDQARKQVVDLRFEGGFAPFQVVDGALHFCAGQFEPGQALFELDALRHDRQLGRRHTSRRERRSATRRQRATIVANSDVFVTSIYGWA